MYSYDDILAQIYEALQPFAKKSVELTEQTSFVEDLGLVSLKVMDLLTEIEDRFDVSIPLNLLPDMRTVRDLAVELQQLASNS